MFIYNKNRRGFSSFCFPSCSPDILICPPLLIEFLTSTSQIPWPHHHWTFETGFARQWGLCRPCIYAVQGGTSRRSCLSPWCLLIAARPNPPPGRHDQNSNLWRMLATHSTQSHLGYPEHCEERTERYVLWVLQQLNGVSVSLKLQKTFR